MAFTYTMGETMSVAELASAKITEYLELLPVTVKVGNVEDNEFFQQHDIDLIWYCKINGVEKAIKVEVKGDRYHKSGNYFIETISNIGKNTPGCFLYTKADYIFYYFVETGDLAIMPVEESREWFKQNIHRFEERQLGTSIAGEKVYGSKGRLVPRKIMNKEVKGMVLLNILDVLNKKNGNKS